MKDHYQPHRSQRKNWAYWIIGLGSILWLLLRSGTKPRRLVYPCQRVALANSTIFLGYLASVVGVTWICRRLKREIILAGVGIFSLGLLFSMALAGSNGPITPVYVNLTLPGWTSGSAVSDVFAVPNVPTPECSLEGGTLPDTAPCDEASYALRDAGVDSMVNEMENRGSYFYRTTTHPNGIVGKNDVVVIKINNQWAEQGQNNGLGRLSTNTDVLKGLLWRILQHPDDFSGEIVVTENTQGVVWNWDVTPANSQDRNQSYQDVVNAFQTLGYPVSLYRWDDLNESGISGGNVGAGGYPTGEYAGGNNNDAYILLEDPDASGTNELSYPKFRTDGGAFVSMRYGVWDGSSYDSDSLTFINLPVLKQHGMAGATIAWKNLIGFLSIYNEDTRYGSWDAMHGFFWGYQDMGDTDYGLLGQQMALIRAPDLNVVDAIWVADDNYDGDSTRQDVLLASTDPFAVDWYASEYVLFPIYSNQDASAARVGTFRSATRVNQNAAASAWSDGSYPYIDLLDSYDSNTPSNDEKNMMNVYVVAGSSTCEAVTDVTISGPTSGVTNTLYTFTANVTPTAATTPITYTWTPDTHVAQSGAGVTYTWSVTGNKTISVSAENCGGSDTDTHTISIEASETHAIYLPMVVNNYQAQPSTCPIPLTSVTISGPTSGYTNTRYTFSAAITPSDATQPIGYTWSPTPSDGAGSLVSAAYRWDSAGVYDLSVEAENCGGTVDADHTISITASAPTSGDLLQPEDLTYLGAFRLPERAGGAPDEQSWEYSAQALTYWPDGDSGGGGDGYPGSLFGTGHDVWNYVSEISIPAPSTSRDLETLEFATTIQGFYDVRAGLFDGLSEMPRVGLQYLPAQSGQTSAKLHMTWGAHHHDEGSPSDTPSHAWCDLDLSEPNTQGAWWIGDESLYRVNGYIFEIPQEWAAAHLDGERLATGRYRDGGWSGMGPNIFAYGPWIDGSPPISGTHLTARTLLSYSFADGEYMLDNYHDSDEWEGGAWLTAGERSAVVFVGTKGGGDYWWYGFSSPDGDGMPCPFIPDPGVGIVRCYNSSDGSDCVPELINCEGYAEESRGWWSSRFDAQMIFYDPADFAAVLNGTMEPYEPQPYARLDIDEHLFFLAATVGAVDCGTGDQRKCRLGEVAYDRERGFLYVLERFADDSTPVVHVWQVQANGG